MKFWGYSSSNSAFCQQDSLCCCSAHTLQLFVAGSLSEEAELIFWPSDYYELQGGVLEPKNVLRAVIAFMSQGRLREEELSPAEKQFSG